MHVGLFASVALTVGRDEVSETLVPAGNLASRSAGHGKGHTMSTAARPEGIEGLKGAVCDGQEVSAEHCMSLCSVTEIHAALLEVRGECTPKQLL